MSTKHRTAYRLTESAVMLAFAAVLSVLKIVDMPYGGSVTAFSMLPLLVIAYRYGTKWGFLTAFTYSLIQLLLGLDNFAYAQGFMSIVMLALFDYLLAFLVLGLGALFRKEGRSQGTALAAAAVFTGILRYTCHAVAGFTVWRDLSVPFVDSLIYSLSYNATYMIPETIILVLGAVYVSRFLSFENTSITRAAAQQSTSRAALTVSVVSKTVALAAAISIVVLLAPAIQNAETGSLFLAGLLGAPWATIGIIAAVGVALVVILKLIAKRLKKA